MAVRIGATLAAVLLASGVGCRSLSELPGLGSAGLTGFGPTEAGVRSALAADRVREALEDALSLGGTYAGPRIDALVGWASYRNADLDTAEMRFRRSAAAGNLEGAVGLGYVRAARGDWESAVARAEAAVDDDRAAMRAHALLAADAWRRGEAARASRRLSSWSRLEPITAEAEILDAISVAAAEVGGVASVWNGGVSRLQGEVVSDALVIPVRVSGTRARMRVDLSYGQTRISPELAEAAGIDVISGRLTAEAEPRRLHAVDQAACDELALGDYVGRGLVVGVAPVEEGVDGVLGADVLSRIRWSLHPAAAVLAVGPAERHDAITRAVTERGSETLGWLDVDLLPTGLAVQMLVELPWNGQRIATAVDLVGRSVVDPSALELTVTDEGVAAALLRLGGWLTTVRADRRSLVERARGGGVAPGAALGLAPFRETIVEWIPGTAQLRLLEPRAPAGRGPGRSS